jgi:transposase-like protein
VVERETKASSSGAEELAEANRRMMYGETWRLRCPPVIASFLRTTSALEPINEEFRRRTKTQALLPSQDAVLLLLLGFDRSLREGFAVGASDTLSAVG